MSFWIQTYTGRQFDFHACTPADVDIEDIARGLSNLCRFTGQVRHHYSVAQHCVLMSSVDGVDPLHALLHDAPEAYVNDLSRPLKHALLDAGNEEYQQIDRRVEKVIFERFGVSPSPHQAAALRHADLRMLVTESIRLLPGGPLKQWAINVETHPPYPTTVLMIERWHPDEAREIYLRRFRELQK